MTSNAKPFVFGARPSHIHKLADGEEIECNSAYCTELTAHPLHQEAQRSPWADVEEE